ncbi:MAG: hypothetical protein KJ622_16530 [Alphaproteobacteria bacterium]|nr:hypothetical protein [Alphaproteobacteria bacterium]
MFETGLVFVIGTCFSFFPLLWVLNRLGQKNTRRVSSPEVETSVDPAHAAFLATLKQEGFERAASAIDLVRQDLERRFEVVPASRGHQRLHASKGEPEIPLLTRERLGECISLVESLFSQGTAERFREAIEALEADYRNRKSHWVNHTIAAVGLLRGELRDGT